MTAWKHVFLSVYRLDHLGGCAAGSVWYWPAHQKISKPLCFAIGEGRSLPKLSRKLPRSLTLIHPSFHPIASCSSHILSLSLSLTLISALYFIYRRQAVPVPFPLSAIVFWVYNQKFLIKEGGHLEYNSRTFFFFRRFYPHTDRSLLTTPRYTRCHNILNDRHPIVRFQYVPGCDQGKTRWTKPIRRVRQEGINCFLCFFSADILCIYELCRISGSLLITTINRLGYFNTAHEGIICEIKLKLRVACFDLKFIRINLFQIMELKNVLNLR